ncbi:MAG: glycosyltransferase family 4 protein [Planctomycetaceae bacterium]|nr:glycosyltransferase family 4 protein [Planctomycetaceae bacterium]
MKIILCHNFYREPGGEDRVLADEERLLLENGHRVVRFTRHSNDIRGEGGLRLALGAVWNRKAAAQLRAIVSSERADIVHFHNTVPLISPAAYYAARRGGAAVVQSLHNYRMICPNGTFFRDGRVCEECSGKLFPWPSIRHACYRGSRAGSTALSTMLATHRVLKTYANAVDVYIALSRFSRQKLVSAGLPAEKIELKPNFVSPDPGPGPGQGGYAACLGRLSPEKGIDVLLDAWSRIDRSLPLKVIGNGPLAERVRAAADANPSVEWLPGRSDEQIREILGDAMFLIVPSVNYEGFPKTIVEAFSRGTPVVASRLGAMGELIDDGRTGMHFGAGDMEDLARTVNTLAGDCNALAAMRVAARAEYENKYTAERNYATLAEIYRIAIERCCRSHPIPTGTQP